MKRKVAKIGPSTLMVSLPSQWVKANNVKKGDELHVEEDRHILKISHRINQNRTRHEIYVKKPKRLITRSIYNLYRKGAYEIKVRYDDPIIIKDIQACLPMLMGFDITDQGNNFLTLRSIMKIDEEQFSSTLRRLFLVTKSLAEESYLAIKKGDITALEGVIELETIQNKYYMFCCRVVNLKAKTLTPFPNLMYLMLQRLEDLADDYKYICRYVIERKVKVSNATLMYYKEINLLLNELYKLYYKYNIDSAQAIIEKKKKLVVKGLTLLEKVPKNDIRVIHILINALIEIYETCSPIMGMEL